jgi:DNA-binding response OmpR family regulator
LNRILLAEDEEHIARLIEFKLKKEGHSVCVARNGVEALERWTEGKWSLVVLDVMMPILDGWSVLKEIRRTDQRVPILMLTAKSSETDVSKSAELGATRFLKKPFDPAELALVVKECIAGPMAGEIAGE